MVSLCLRTALLVLLACFAATVGMSAEKMVGFDWEGSETVTHQGSGMDSNADGLIEAACKSNLEADLDQPSPVAKPTTWTEEEEEEGCTDAIGTAACQDLADDDDDDENDEPIHQTCIRLFDIMREDCRRSCQLCNLPSDHSDTVARLYSQEPQTTAPQNTKQFWKHHEQMDEYMYNQVYMSGADDASSGFSLEDSEHEEEERYPLSVRLGCQNRHAECVSWALRGECEANPKYMKVQCAPACFSCEQLQYSTRCAAREDEESSWSQAGDLNRMFERLVSDPFFQQRYNPTILSQPSKTASEEAKTNDNHDVDEVYNGDPGVHGDVCAEDDEDWDEEEDDEDWDEEELEEGEGDDEDWEDNEEDEDDGGPWVVVLDNFLSDQECQTMIDLGAQAGYERSQDVGQELFDGSFDGVISDQRTSTNAWCSDDVCFHHETTRAIHERMKNLTGIPPNHYEHLQLLRYEEGQYYVEHHDYIEHDVDRLPGPRILTIFLYLNDVEKGGGTNFPRLGNLTVMPKRGRALLWPSVLDRDPMARDDRTHHQALPVELGVKYGANAWVHQRDFRQALDDGCA